jgi:Tfp pilus assembly protein PilF
MYVLATFAKPSLVVLPVMAGVIETLLRRARVRDVAWLLGVWVALAIPMSLVTVSTQGGHYGGPVPLWGRPLVAADSVGWYLEKVVWPWPMGPDYGRTPGRIWATREIWWTWLVPTTVVAAAWVGRRRAPWAVGTLGVFVAGALPCLGLVTFVFQRYSTVADRYIYLGMLGVGIAAAAVVRRWPRAVWPVAAVCAVWAAGSIVQSATWRTTRSLMGHALAVNPTSRVAHDVLAYLATEEKNDAEAVRQYSMTLEAFPADGFANYNMGNRALAGGRLDEAIGYYTRALEERGGDAQVRANLGVALARSGKAEAAEREFRKATELSPDWAPAWGNLGAILAAEGRAEEARRAYGRALDADPNYAMARAGLRKLDATP